MILPTPWDRTCDGMGLGRVKRLVKQLLGKELWIWPQIRVKTLFLGSCYGGYAIMAAGLNPESICYSFGLGEDISFDLALIERFGPVVHAYDPTPKSMAWLETQRLPPQFKFQAMGLADYDGVAFFANPSRETHVSFRISKVQPDSAEGITVPVASLASLMAKNGHPRVDLLKMDVEGAEYQVLDHIIATRPAIDQILLEFHPEMVTDGFKRTLDVLERLNVLGYRIFAISPDGRNFSLKQIS